MIRYAISAAELEQRIRAHKSSWMRRAKTRTDRFIENGEYDESSGIWSEIKPVFMDLQFNKCVFCEREFEDVTFGSIEHDLEHFRPKSSVKKWPADDAEVQFDFAMGATNDTGYFWLAYDLGNYAASCKSCNSTLKSNAFPIASDRGSAVETVGELLDTEEPYLCYPIGDVDIDPEELIDFVGIVAKPRLQNGPKNRRARVIIEFFKLNDREILQNQRANEISNLGFALEQVEAGATGEIDWEEAVESLVADNRPHAACKRAFLERWNDDRAFAEQLLTAARQMVFSRNLAS